MSPNELSELAPLAATLNEESNHLNQTIASLNERIAALNLGISVWTALLTDDEGPDTEYQIGFTKFDMDGQKWQLAYRQRRRILDASGDEFVDDDDNPHFSVPVPLLQTSRNLRIEGLEFVPELLRLMKMEAERRIMAMQRGKKLVAELESGGSPPAATRTKIGPRRRTIQTSNPDVPFVEVDEG